VDEIIEQGLHEYLDDLQTQVNAVGAGIHETFFAFKAPKSRKKTQRQVAQ
jgi:uncharacterized alpha-E superfamily protein